MKNKNDRKIISTKNLYLGELVLLDDYRQPIIENEDIKTNRYVIVRKSIKREFSICSIDTSRYLDIFTKTVYKTVGNRENAKGDTIVYNLIPIVTNMPYLSINDATKILLESNPTIIEVETNLDIAYSSRTRGIKKH